MFKSSREFNFMILLIKHEGLTYFTLFVLFLTASSIFFLSAVLPINAVAKTVTFSY